MQSIIYLVLLLGTSLVTASPLQLDIPQPIDLNPLNTADGLLKDPLPWGPDEFTIAPEHITLPIGREAAFMSTIRFLAEQATEDFDGQLPAPRTIFRDPRYPNLAIAVSSIGRSPRIARKYVMWAMARIMNEMIVNDAFAGSVFVLRWRTTLVGRILFIAGNLNQLNNSWEDAVTTQPRLEIPTPQHKASNATVPAVGHSNAISFDFELIGDVLQQQDIFMGTIGALIQIAQHTDHAFPHWIGSFPQYHCFHIFRSIVEPSVLSKKLIIVTMVAEVTFALGRNDWHELRTSIKRDGVVVAQGAYADFPTPDVASA